MSMTAEEIAAKLTKAQREAVARMVPDRWLTSGWHGVTGMAATLLCTRTPPLAERDWIVGGERYAYRLTSLGLEVRAILERQP